MSNQWLFEIKPKSKLIDFKFKEIWTYKDLLFLFVKRDVVTLYKQTILGPLWYIIQPLFTSVIFTLVFNKIANIETGGIPPFLFNLAGVTSWNYFKECLTATADTFKKNQNIFGKVYFPRIIMPLSIVFSSLLKYGIQFLILISFYIYFYLSGWDIQPSIYLAFYPLLIIFMALLSLGLGMTISSMVTKYRDLSFLISFGVQLLMYISLVTLPYSLFEKLGYNWIIDYNPMAHIIELSRYFLFGEGTFTTFSIIFTAISSVLIFLIGVIIFNRAEKSFIDTI